MRILVAEDDPDIGSFLKKHLEHKSFVVDWIEHGDEASFAARTNEYDLLILDNMMPGKYGGTIVKEVRGKHNTVPILMLSVLGDTQDKVELLNLGADDYLAKPFSIDELFARIGALLRRPPQVVRQRLQVGPLVLDQATYEVRRGEEDIRLTRKEFALLRYMMRNKEIMLSRAMLLEHVWNMDTDPFSNTVEAHIATLRKKIDHHHTQKLIKTVQGMGYKITDSG